MIPAVLAALRGAQGMMGAAGSLSGSTSGLQKKAGQLGDVANLVGTGDQLKGTIKDLVNPFKHLEKAAHKLYEGVNFLPGKILEVEEMIVSTGQNWVNALAAPIDTVKKLGDAVGRFTSLSNPALSKMFDYRADNAFATIGRVLEPIMEALSRAAQTVGDTFAKLRPALEPAMKAVALLIDMLAKDFALVAETLAPTIQAVGTLFLGLVRVMNLLAEPARFLVKTFNSLRSQLFGLLGIPDGWKEDAKATIAAREPRYTSAEEIQREMAKNALMASAGAKKEEDPVKQATISIPQILNEILTWLSQNLGPQALLSLIKAFAAELEDLLPDVPGMPGSGADLGALGRQMLLGRIGV